MNRRDFLSTVGAGIAGSVAGPTAVHALATSATGDIAIVREILTALHPGLYRYNSPVGIDAALSRLARQWADQPDLAARYLNLSQFLATLKCGHSYANFYNQNRARFSIPERRVVRFAVMGPEQVAAASQPTEQEIHAYYRQNAAQ